MPLPHIVCAVLLHVLYNVRDRHARAIIDQHMNVVAVRLHAYDIEAIAFCCQMHQLFNALILRLSVKYSSSVLRHEYDMHLQTVFCVTATPVTIHDDLAVILFILLSLGVLEPLGIAEKSALFPSISMSVANPDDILPLMKYSCP